MIKQTFLFGTTLLLLNSCNNSSSLVIDDFETGNFNNWTIEGNAFGNAPAEGSYQGQQSVANFQGKYFANSFANGDDATGVLTSRNFTIEQNYINFLIGGGTHPQTYIELLIDGQSVQKSHAVSESETLQWFSWNVQQYKGKTAVIRIVDNQKGGWGHILIDQIEQGNTPKSEFLIDYAMLFNVSEKYLLLPMEDQAPETKIRLLVDGKQVGEPMDFRLAQNKIDYWVPLEVDNYKGQNVELLFSPIKKTAVGYAQIKQSAVFEFNYNEAYRPVYHFSPQYGWMNDPNGMVYKDGEYHLFYQYNPYGTRWGNMHWGHAVSKNLIHWEYLPVAIAPDTIGTIFSGSAVVDKDNTAGFGKDAIVAIFTSAGKRQTQSIAYSLDNGRTFTKYEGNPVLTDEHIVDFRDPKVFWHEKTKQWIMSLATSQTISFYGSPNLKQWVKLSEFGNGIGSHGGVWECPDLFPLKYNGQEKWVLLVSINPGGVNGGSATQYFIGNFDGKEFKADDLPYPLWVDYGRDNYAGVTWSNIPEKDGRYLFIGWMNNWDYANEIPLTNFRSAMTLPREFKLTNNGKHLVLGSFPVTEVEALRRSEHFFDNQEITSTHTIEKLLPNNTGSYELNFEVVPQNSTSFSFKLLNEKQEEVTFAFDLHAQTLEVNRNNSGEVSFNTNFAQAPIIAPLALAKSYKIRLFADKNSIEIFINDGKTVQTNTVFPTEPYNGLTFITEQGKIKIENLRVYNLSHP